MVWCQMWLIPLWLWYLHCWCAEDTTVLPFPETIIMSCQTERSGAIDSEIMSYITALWSVWYYWSHYNTVTVVSPFLMNWRYHSVVEVVTSFPTKYMKTHMYNTFTVVNTQNVHMYCVGGCQKKPRLIELAAAVFCFNPLLYRWLSTRLQ